MGAGLQRWWRESPKPLSYEWPDNPELTRAITADTGIEIRCRLYLTQLIYYGTFQLDEEPVQHCIDCGAPLPHHCPRSSSFDSDEGQV